jgi:hypothetical protein
MLDPEPLRIRTREPFSVAAEIERNVPPPVVTTYRSDLEAPGPWRSVFAEPTFCVPRTVAMPFSLEAAMAAFDATLLLSRPLSVDWSSPSRFPNFVPSLVVPCGW